MKLRLKFGVTLLTIIFAPAGVAQTTSPGDCTALWKEADASVSGALTKAQAQPYVTDFSAVDIDKDGIISNTEFLTGCSTGQVRKSGALSGAVDTPPAR
jgi:hypothetical protein